MRFLSLSRSILFLTSIMMLWSSCKNDDDVLPERVIPPTLQFRFIPSQTITMGGNTVANDAPEVSVTLSDFEMSEREICNMEYMQFLNQALAEGWVTVSEEQTMDPCGTYTEMVVRGAGEAPNAGEIYLILGETGGCTSNGEPEHIDNKSWLRFNDSEQTFELIEEDKDAWPINWVSWFGANAFAEFFSLSLPTEAQWECAARGGQQLEYPTEDS